MSWSDAIIFLAELKEQFFQAPRFKSTTGIYV